MSDLRGPNPPPLKRDAEREGSSPHVVSSTVPLEDPCHA